MAISVPREVVERARRNAPPTEQQTPKFGSFKWKMSSIQASSNITTPIPIPPPPPPLPVCGTVIALSASTSVISQGLNPTFFTLYFPPVTSYGFANGPVVNPDNLPTQNFYAYSALRQPDENFVYVTRENNLTSLTGLFADEATNLFGVYVEQGPSFVRYVWGIQYEFTLGGEFGDIAGYYNDFAALGTLQELLSTTSIYPPTGINVQYPYPCQVS